MTQQTTDTIPPFSTVAPARTWAGSASSEGHGFLDLDIHGVASIRVGRTAPTALLFEEMFAPFKVPGLSAQDLLITRDLEPMPGSVRAAESQYRFTETALLDTSKGIQIVADGAGYRLHGKGELLTAALPLIDRIVSLRGVAMIHAATVSYKGRGICLPASGGTGKTSTIAKLLRIEGMAFMGDDWAFLSDNGRQLGYAKPIFIKPHHRPIYPHLFARRRKPLVPSSLTEPLARFATWVHPVVANYPSLARFLRHWSPEHMMVTPREAFPNAEIATEAVLGVAMFVERCDGDQVILRERDTAWMVSRMIGNFFYEIPPHSQQVVTALGASGLVPLDDLFARKATVLRQALGAAPTFHLQVPASWSPDQASDAIVEHIKRIFPLG